MPGRNNLGNKKILIVDDKTDFVEILTFTLKKKVYECISSHNGMDALNKTAKKIPTGYFLSRFLVQVLELI